MCCGSQRRQEFRPQTRQGQLSAPLAIGFEYVGTTGLTVVGPVTRKRYRFESHGSRVAIDPRDAPSMAAVPHLRRA
jgi:hypothetical protein